MFATARKHIVGIIAFIVLGFVIGVIVCGFLGSQGLQSLYGVLIGSALALVGTWLSSIATRKNMMDRMKHEERLKEMDVLRERYEKLIQHIIDIDLLLKNTSKHFIDYIEMRDQRDRGAPLSPDYNTKSDEVRKYLDSYNSVITMLIRTYARNMYCVYLHAVNEIYKCLDCDDDYHLHFSDYVNDKDKRALIMNNYIASRDKADESLEDIIEEVRADIVDASRTETEVFASGGCYE